MQRWQRNTLVVAGLIAAVGVGLNWYIQTYESREHSRVAYMDQCANCHGENLAGTEQGPALAKRQLALGDSTPALMAAITAHKSPAWGDSLSTDETKSLALYISEQQQQFPTISESYSRVLPDQSITSQHHDFVVEHLVDLSSPPYSIAPLPDGRCSGSVNLSIH